MRISKVFRFILVLVVAAPRLVRAGRTAASAGSIRPGCDYAARARRDVHRRRRDARSEAAPIHIADQGPSGAGFQVIDGGVRTVALRAPMPLATPRRRCCACSATTPTCGSCSRSLTATIGSSPRPGRHQPTRRPEGQAHRRPPQHLGQLLTWWRCCARQDCRNRRHTGDGACHRHGGCDGEG